MGEQQAPAADENPEGGEEVGHRSSAPEEGAAGVETEILGQHSSAPEEGATGVVTEIMGQHSSAPEEGEKSAEALPAPVQVGPLAAPNWDRVVIVLQLLAGIALVVFGALVAALSKSATREIGTAVIGIGAALLPAGAAASASARIVHSKSNSGA